MPIINKNEPWQNQPHIEVETFIKKQFDDQDTSIGEILLKWDDDVK